MIDVDLLHVCECVCVGAGHTVNATVLSISLAILIGHLVVGQYCVDEFDAQLSLNKWIYDHCSSSIAIADIADIHRLKFTVQIHLGLIRQALGVAGVPEK